MAPMGKKGKYADIIDTLPRSLGTEPDYQEKVNVVKKNIIESIPDPEHLPLSSEVIVDLIADVTPLQKVINDSLIQAMNGKMQASNLARIYADVRRMKSAFETQEKVTNILEDAYKQLLIDQYEAEATTSLTLDDGASVRIQSEPHGRIVDKDANRKWAMDNGLETSLALPWQTVNALTKEMLLRGEEPPDGVEAEARTKVVFTKG